jgi:Carbohydrate esterase, sialic acid-specific acetylesterase
MGFLAPGKAVSGSRAPLVSWLWLATALLIVPPASGAFANVFDVDAKMAQFEAQVSAETIALGRNNNNTAPGGLLQQMLAPQDFARITDPRAIASAGNPSRRQDLPCMRLATLRPAVILVAGQSNAANTAELGSDGERFRTDRPVYNLKFDDDMCYPAENPLLGADGSYQSFPLPLAAQLIDANIFRRVLIVPISVSGTFIEEWAPPLGHHWPRFTRALSVLERMGLQPDFILWHHGEGNSGILKNIPNASRAVRDAQRLSYIRNVLSIVDGLRALGVAAPFFAAVATKCGSEETVPEIRAAQLALPDSGWKIYQGPDTDTLDQSYRSPTNQCHFSHAGNLAHANKWFEVLRSYRSAHPPQSRWIPDVKIQANQKSSLEIGPGESYTLSYSSSGASSCTMSYASVSEHGSFSISPGVAAAVRTGLAGSYKLSCRSAAGVKSSASVAISVVLVR